MQCQDPTTGETGYYPVRIVVRGKAKVITPGKVAKSKKMEASLEIEIMYIKIEIDGDEIVELDKLNFVYKLLGVDQMETIRSQC